MNTEVVDVQYSNHPIPAEIAENFEELFPEHDELSFQEILLAQESVYESFQASGNERNHVTNQRGESSQLRRSESEIALDEAIALSLELHTFDNISLPESRVTLAGSSNRGASSSSEETSAAHQDTADPDSMTYEELLELRDTVGTESKGLPKELMAMLPTFKHKTTFFSKKKNHQECVICYMPYKNGHQLITLPCMHMYHSKCITRWLKQSKNCPFCTKEVTLSEP